MLFLLLFLRLVVDARWCFLFFTCIRVLLSKHLRVCGCSCVSVFTMLNLPVVVCRRVCIFVCVCRCLCVYVFVHVRSVFVFMCKCMSMSMYVSISMAEALSWFCLRVVLAPFLVGGVKLSCFFRYRARPQFAVKFQV